jgi:hypothetical protein
MMALPETWGNIDKGTLLVCPGFLNVNLLAIINTLMVVHTSGMTTAPQQIRRLINWLHGMAYRLESKERTLGGNLKAKCSPKLTSLQLYPSEE